MGIGGLRAFLILLLAAGLFAGSASAVLPDSGWYFNPAEGGRGFNIEIQGDTLFMAGFVYDTAGNPIWVVSGGPMSTDRTYSGAAFQTANGQPLGGAYRAPSTVPFGMASVDFLTTTSADIVVNGYSFSVMREQFGLDFTSTTAPLLGEFAFVIGNTSFPAYFGQRITFTSTQLFNGSTYAVGNLTGKSGVVNMAVGQYVPALGQWLLLLDSSAIYWQSFSFAFEGFNLVEGSSSTYLKGTLPTSSSNVIGNRIKSAQAATGADAPGVINGIRPAVEIAADGNAAAMVAAQIAYQPSPTQVEVLRELESVLQAYSTMRK
jgi:hypothetical protein